MSNFMTVMLIVETSAKERLIKALHQKAESCGIGVWFDNRYVDEFEIFLQTSDTLSFDIADHYLHDNCEELLAPWWYCDCGEELFNLHMSKIQSIVEECLKYSNEVNLFIGQTDGVSYHDFVHVALSPASFYSEMIKQYEADQRNVPPYVHFIFKSQ